MQIIAQRLKETRAKRGVTQATIASAIGIQEVAYQRYEYGTRVPAAESLCKLADYFNISTDYLLGRTDNPKINK
ncbi:helix-turn-helix transcriptional regulator [uncultured Sporomusa sp.]|uniref:helix-turn-helix domain-containing protein n=1 Tax=uncultured Sporomusa sp. TaxID=307249 RepID=UPI00258F14D1|nr:helix-turn-helix transcriptional regulator [uncultured Sporomusa sp.]